MEWRLVKMIRDLTGQGPYFAHLMLEKLAIGNPYLRDAV